MYYLSDILYYVLVSEQMRNKFKYEKYNICNIVNQNTLKIASHGSLLSLSWRSTALSLPSRLSASQREMWKTGEGPATFYWGFGGTLPVSNECCLSSMKSQSSLTRHHLFVWVLADKLIIKLLRCQLIKTENIDTICFCLSPKTSLQTEVKNQLPHYFFKILTIWIILNWKNIPVSNST